MTAEQVKVTLVCNIMGMSVLELLMIYFNDLSAQVYEDVKKANEAIEAATKEKESFFATISHEIRNPLQSLQGSVDLLGEMRDAPESSQERARLMEICKSCCALVINMVSNILDMSKIASGKMQLSPAPADLRELTRRILQISHSRAEGKEVKLEFDCDPSLPPAVELDTQRVEQVLLNLISNAIKFTPSKGRVVVKLAWHPLDSILLSAASTDPVRAALARSSWQQTMELEERISASGRHALHHEPDSRRHYHTTATDRGRPAPRLEANITSTSNPSSPQPGCGVVKAEVMDTGIGISPEGVLRLFQPYQQAEAGISRFHTNKCDPHRRYGGTGLGLWISRNILKLMNGEIRVKSKPGKGSNFIVAFPAKVAPEVAAVARGEEESVPGAAVLSGKRYMLLDDIAENTFILEQALRRYRASTVNYQDGGLALEAYKVCSSAVDGIITDLRMPAMSGQTFIVSIRRFEKEAHIARPAPILVVTGENSGEEKRLCLAQGANEFLLKPVKLRDLISALVKFHSRPQAANKPKRVLIVDDEVISSRLVAAILSQQGHICTNAFSVAEGIKQLIAQEFDLIVLDGMLGDGTGADFLRAATKAVSQLPKVVSVSGNSAQEQMRTYEAEGFGGAIAGCLQKPARKQELVQMVQVV